MKDLSNISVCVCDYGYFLSIAQKFAESAKRVRYWSPTGAEFLSVDKCVIGTGLPDVIRCDDPFSPEVVADTDLYVFPDIGMTDIQEQLRSLGKAVWGSFGATDLEIYRTKFLSWVKALDLPYSPYLPVYGLADLRKLLARVQNKWIKVDRYRAEMETWFHQDLLHSEAKLNDLAKRFGPERPTFIVQDVIDTKIEVGYDGWAVDGKYPNSTYQGYEGKNEIYLGAMTKYEALPQAVRDINEAISPTLRDYGYRNNIATEIRVLDGQPYYIDPTMRMPGQTGEQLLETCSNFCDVVWHGANGEVLSPTWNFKFAASATIHNNECEPDEWKVLQVPKAVSRWTKLAHFCYHNEAFHFPPCHTAELGVVLACGNTIQEVFRNLKRNVSAFADEPVSFHLEKFFDLLDDIRAAERAGMKFSDGTVPTNKEILQYAVE